MSYDDLSGCKVITIVYHNCEHHVLISVRLLLHLYTQQSEVPVYQCSEMTVTVMFTVKSVKIIPNLLKNLCEFKARLH